MSTALDCCGYLFLASVAFVAVVCVYWAWQEAAERRRVRRRIVRLASGRAATVVSPQPGPSRASKPEAEDREWLSFVASREWSEWVASLPVFNPADRKFRGLSS